MVKSLLFAAYLVFASTFLLFSLLEFAPGLAQYMNLQPIRYYAQSRDYRPDDTLVFIPTKATQGTPTTLQTEFLGDLYSPEYGVPNPAVKYHATYTADGFRSNSSTSDFKVVVIGDSYVEIGEEDALTLSEQLKQQSGLSTFNLGRGWYGPFQYLELLKRYGSIIRPRYAVLCFFDGNDAEDTRQFLKWQGGRSYYSFVLSTKSYLGRYFTAFRDTQHYIRDRITFLVRSIVSPTPTSSRSNSTEGVAHSATSADQGTPPDLGLIRIGDQVTPMRFGYWNSLKTTDELLETEEWKAIGKFLNEYERLAAQYDIEPLVVFLPTKIEVYGSQYLETSGKQFLEKIKTQLEFENNSHEAFLRLVKATKLRFVDLLPEFRAKARAGQLLYYPFDSHWNVEGRRIAAALIGHSFVE
jgi:hypothetical protein